LPLWNLFLAAVHFGADIPALLFPFRIRIRPPARRFRCLLDFPAQLASPSRRTECVARTQWQRNSFSLASIPASLASLHLPLDCFSAPGADRPDSLATTATDTASVLSACAIPRAGRFRLSTDEFVFLLIRLPALISCALACDFLASTSVVGTRSSLIFEPSEQGSRFLGSHYTLVVGSISHTPGVQWNMRETLSCLLVQFWFTEVFGFLLCFHLPSPVPRINSSSIAMWS
jgi:hypothetical protein